MSSAFKLCKGETDGANKPQLVPFLVETKGTSFAFGSNYNPCCASSAALICHQARAVTTELSLRHCLFFCHQNQQPGAMSSPGICTGIQLHSTASFHMFLNPVSSSHTSHTSVRIVFNRVAACQCAPIKVSRNLKAKKIKLAIDLAVHGAQFIVLTYTFFLRLHDGV